MGCLRQEGGPREIAGRSDVCGRSLASIVGFHLEYILICSLDLDLFSRILQSLLRFHGLHNADTESGDEDITVFYLNFNYS